MNTGAENRPWWRSLEFGAAITAAAGLGFLFWQMDNKKFKVGVAHEAERPFEVTKRTEFRCPKKARVVGLQNNGNTCFLNSILQALSSLREFRRYLHELRESHPSSQLFIELQRVVDGNTSDPVRVHRCVAQEEDMYSGNDQQDAHELFTSLLTAIETETRRLTRNKSNDSNWYSPTSKFKPIKMNLAQDRKRGEGGVKRAKHRAPTSVDDNSSGVSSSSSSASGIDTNVFTINMPFLGSSANTKQCLDCGYTPPVRLSGYHSLGLSLHGASSLQVKSLLLGYIKPERLNSVMCEHCSAEEVLKSVQQRQKLSQKTNSKWSTPHAREILRKREAKLTSFLDTGLNAVSEGKAAADSAAEAANAIFHVPGDTKKSAMTLDRLEKVAKCDVVKRELLLQLPRVLCLHLQRGLGSHKNEQQVAFGLTLDLSPIASMAPWVLKNQIGSSRSQDGSEDAFRPLHTTEQPSSLELLYLLNSVVVHLGGARSGHYITYRRNVILQGGQGNDSVMEDVKRVRESRWFRVSDAAVTEVEVSEVLACQAYLLFYERAASMPAN